MPETQHATAQASPGRLLRIQDVERETSLSRWTIRRRIAAGEFPKPVALGGNRVAWPEREIEAWKQGVLEAAQ